MNKLGFNLFGVMVFYSLAISPANAYLDPGTGSMLIQGLIAGVASLALVLKLYWHRLLALLGIRKKIIIDDDEEAFNESPDENESW